MRICTLKKRRKITKKKEYMQEKIDKMHKKYFFCKHQSTKS